MFTGILMIILAWVVEMPVWLSVITTICGALKIFQPSIGRCYLF